MNYEQLFDIAKDLTRIDYFKAKKLFNLIQKHIYTDDIVEKRKLEKRIRSLIFYCFMNVIDKDSKKELYNVILCNNDIINELEFHNPNWFINADGAFEYTFDNDKTTIIGQIPREYNKGYYLDEDNCSEEEKLFYDTNKLSLLLIGNNYDRKEEIITDEYTTRFNISKEFTEKLIDFIGFKRINSKESDTKKRVK